MFASRAQQIAEVIEPALPRANGCCATALPIPPKPIRVADAGWAAKWF